MADPNNLDWLPKQPTQIDLIKLIKDNGLKPGDILSGIRWELSVNELFEETKKVTKILGERINRK